MSRRLGLLTLSIFTLFSAYACQMENQEELTGLDILAKLSTLEGATVREIEPHYGYPRAFQIDLWQPVDHSDPNGPGFTQRLYLHHLDEGLPMVLGLSGYGANSDYVLEPAAIIRSNHLAVVHRYFYNARPNPLDWTHLTIRQAANDHHRIVKAFKRIYPGKWISTGASKGGMTCLFHKRFFPDDVDAVIAYVAPIMRQLNDPRFLDYFSTIGTDEGKRKIVAFQRHLLLNRETLVPRMVAWFLRNNLSYSGDPDQIFEGRVRSYPWNFWQYHDVGTDQIPELSSDPDLLIEHFASVSKLARSSNAGYDYYLPFYVQSYTQLGTPAQDDSAIVDLLRYRSDDSAAFMNSFTPPLVFHYYPMLDIAHWLYNRGDHIIYLYGEIDPWSGGAVDFSPSLDALKVVQAGGDHTIRLGELDDYPLVIERLENWLNISIPRQRVLPNRYYDLRRDALHSLSALK